MKTETMVLMVAAIWAAALFLPSGGSRSERRAEQELCSRLVAQVHQGQSSLAQYLGTRCAAKLLAGADQATADGAGP